MKTLIKNLLGDIKMIKTELFYFPGGYRPPRAGK